jgi:hypothetical protein
LWLWLWWLSLRLLLQLLQLLQLLTILISRLSETLYSRSVANIGQATLDDDQSHFGIGAGLNLRPHRIEDRVVGANMLARHGLKELTRGSNAKCSVVPSPINQLRDQSTSELVCACAQIQTTTYLCSIRPW